MLFSILLPSRDRLSLLCSALESIRVQDFDDYEIVISDNASEEPYEGHLSEFDELNIRLIRSVEPLSVTENWNRVLAAARGQYVIMLGDDDALTPGLLVHLATLIKQHEQPEVLYLQAYHYAYPGVVPSSPDGFFCSVSNSRVFFDHEVPYFLDVDEARKLGRQGLNFRHHVSFNAQHFVWRQDYLKSVAAPFFQSPYPDYFACFTTFLTVKRMLVVPYPLIIVGISKKSFGFFYLNGQEAAGTKKFLHRDEESEKLADGDVGLLESLQLSGSMHYRNWLIATIYARRAMSIVGDLGVALRRYRRIQINELAQRAAYLKTVPTADFWAILKGLPKPDQKFGKRIFFALQTLLRFKSVPKDSALNESNNLLGIYDLPRIEAIDIGSHVGIMDAVKYLQSRDAPEGIVGRLPQQDARLNAKLLEYKARAAELEARLLHESRIMSTKVDRSELDELENRFRHENNLLQAKLSVAELALEQERKSTKALTEEILLRIEKISSENVSSHTKNLKLIKVVQWASSEPVRIHKYFTGMFLGGGGTAVEDILRSGYFDADYYLTEYPDVQNSGGDPLEHYVHFGAAEGRNPSAEFSTNAYLEDFPDVKSSGLNPLLHYVRFGKDEGRVARSTEEDIPENEDMIRIRESGIFDGDWYLENYRDVAAAGLDPLEHFVKHGWLEGRDPNGFFQTEWYRTIYPDIIPAQADPLQHFLQWGASEGRDPCPDFQVNWYREQCPELMESEENPLAHYLRVGRQNGVLIRDPNWIYRQKVINELQNAALSKNDLIDHIGMMVIKPQFSILIEGAEGGSLEGVKETLGNQVYRDFEVFDFDARAKLESKQKSDCELKPHFIVVLKSGDILHPNALYEYAAAINLDSQVDLIYADEDSLETGERANPFRKPDWSEDYLESCNYIGSGCCMRFNGVSEFYALSKGLYDLLLRLTEKSDRIFHIRKILVHKNAALTSPATEKEIELDINSLLGRLKRTGRKGKVKPIEEATLCYEITADLTERPLVSIVIPTAAKSVEINGKQVDLLQNCLTSILDKSTYENVEFIIVDNGDLSPEKQEMLKSIGAKTITWYGRDFNIAKKLNLGVSIAKGDLLLLLNDDIEPINSDWIERMVEQFQKPHVGVVGVKLLYPDETLQHAGVILNRGYPDHVYRGEPRASKGYFFSNAAPRNFIGVTGACMMTPTELYRKVGGYNEDLAISYNDVDYCLRARSEGFSSVYTPLSELFHFESQSRDAFADPNEVKTFSEEWAETCTYDDFYNEMDMAAEPPKFQESFNRRRV